MATNAFTAIYGTPAGPDIENEWVGPEAPETPAALDLAQSALEEAWVGIAPQPSLYEDYTEGFVVGRYFDPDTGEFVEDIDYGGTEGKSFEQWSDWLKDKWLSNINLRDFEISNDIKPHTLTIRDKTLFIKNNK